MSVIVVYMAQEQGCTQLTCSLKPDHTAKFTSARTASVAPKTARAPQSTCVKIHDQQAGFKVSGKIAEFGWLKVRSGERVWGGCVG